MQIFATADIHGNRKIVDMLPDVVRDEQPDMVLICGDIGGKINASSLRTLSSMQKRDATYLFRTLEKCGVSFRFILGNDDWFEYDHPCCCAAPEKIAKAIQLIPFEYVPITPFKTNREANENKIEYELEKISLRTKLPTIIIAHSPPLGAADTLYNGASCGSEAIRKWIRKNNPFIWLCGHIHESFGVAPVGNTVVFNCACSHENDVLRGWMLDTDNQTYRSVIVQC